MKVVIFCLLFMFFLLLFFETIGFLVCLSACLPVYPSDCVLSFCSYFFLVASYQVLEVTSEKHSGTVSWLRLQSTNRSPLTGAVGVISQYVVTVMIY